MSRVLLLLFFFGFATAPLIAQGSVDPLEQLCKKKKLGRNDPKKDDIGDQDGDPCTNNSVTFQLTDPSCAGSSDGVIQTLPDGLRLPITYRWSTGATTADLTDLPAGNFHLVVQDADNCTSSFTLTLNGPDSLNLTVEVSNAATAAATDGSAIAFPSGGNGGFNYAWSNGTTINPTGNTLAPGMYAVSVTDVRGCTDSASLLIGSNEGGGTPVLSANAGTSHAACTGQEVNLGANQVAVGGVSPYTYNWAGPFAPSAPNAANPTAILSTAGSHTFVVTVTDGNGQMVTDQVTFTTENLPATTLSSTNNEVCSQDGPVGLQGLPVGGSYSGAGVSGASFDPTVAGPGTHTLTYDFATAAGCAMAATTTIIVRATVSPDWSLPTNPVYTCTLPINPDNLVTGTEGGQFSGPLVNTDGLLDPSLVAGAGDYLVTYTVGSGSCITNQALQVTISNLPNASLNMPTLGTCDFPVPVFTLLSSPPVPGGTFSGGPYLNGRGELDPAGLSPGQYPIYYTYGPGTCRQVVEGSFSVVDNPMAPGFQMNLTQNVVLLNDQSVGAGAYQYTFGDGASSADPDPIHAYDLPGVYEVCQTVSNACQSLTNCQTVVVQEQPGVLALNIRVLLGGNYDPDADMLSDALRDQGFLPGIEPYSEMGYVHKFGGGQEQINPALLNQTGPGAPVDYLLIELRFKQDPSVRVASITTLLTRDGRVIDMNGQLPAFTGLQPDDYFVVVRHRNHLPVMTQVPVSLSEIPQQIDFRNPATATFGNGAQWLIGDTFCLWPGDTDFDGQVVYSGSGTDVNPISTAVFLNPANGSFSPSLPLFGYHPEDLDLDGQVIYSGQGTDVNRISTSVFLNPDNGSFSPSFPLQGQVPPEVD